MVRKKPDTESEGGSLPPNDEVVRVEDLEIMPYSVPRVHFSKGRVRIPKLLSDDEVIQSQQQVMDLEESDCESEGDIDSSEDETVCREAEQSAMDMDSFDLCGPMAELQIAPRETVGKGVILLNIKTRTLYAKSYLIYDSGASVHLIRDISLFEGLPVRIPDNEVSVVGFNTSYGSALALAKGVLKWPLEGVEAFYSRNCIGNIISEFKLRDTHQIVRDSHPNKWLDTETATRIIRPTDNRDELTFKRGLEGLLVCDVISMTANRYLRTAYTFPTIADYRSSSPRVGSVEGSVPEWLERLGLTAREAQAAIALGVFSSISLKLVMSDVMNCMDIPLEKRVDISGRGSLIKGSGKSTRHHERYTDLGKLDNTLYMLRNIRSDTMACLSRASGPANGESIRTLNGAGSCSSCSSSMDLESVPTVSVKGIAGGTRHEPVSNLSMKIGGGGAVQSTAWNPEEGSSLTSMNCDLTLSSPGICGSRNRVDGSDSVPVLKTTTCLVRASTELNLSDQEKSAVLRLICLKLSIGELMVAWYAVSEGLTAESMIVGLTLRQRGLSKAAIDRIAQVGRLHQLTSYTSLDGLKLMIKNELLKGLDVALGTQDVERYQEYVHQLDCACTMGKIRAPSAMVHNHEANYQHTCFCDVFQLTTDDKKWRYYFFLGVDIESQYVFTERITDSSTQELQRAITCIEALYTRHKRKLEGLVFDNAGGLLSKDMKTFLSKKGLLTSYSTPGLHVRIAEASVKVVKSLCRTTILDWATARKFITTFVPYLVTWVTQSINYCLRSGTEFASPYLRFTGKPINMNVHLRYAFLDTVAIHRLAATGKLNNLQSKGAVGLVVARDGDAGAMTVLNLESLEECKRYHLKLMDGPEVTKYVNSRLIGPEFSAENFAKGDSEVAGSVVEDLEITSADVELLKAQIKEMVYPTEVDKPTAIVQPRKAKSKAKKPVKVANLEGGTTNNPEPVLGVIPSNLHTMRSRSDAKHAEVSVEVLKKEQAFSSETPEDGSCLFHSVACYFYKDPGSYASTMRHAVCDYLDKNRNETIDGISLGTIMLTGEYRSVEEYVENMRKTTTYTDDLEIWVLSRIYNLAIITYTQVNNTFVFSQATVSPSVNQEKPRMVYLNYVAGDHCEPLFVTDSSVRKVHLKRYVHNNLKPVSPSSQKTDPTDALFKFDLHMSEEGRRLKKKSKGKVSASEGAEANVPAEYNPTTGRFLDEYEEELIQEFVMLSVLWSDQEKKPAKKKNSKDNALRTRRGDKAVDQAGRDEIAQMRKKEVMTFQTEAEVSSVYKRDIVPVPLVMLNKEKFGSDGAFDKVKARLIALGNLQEALERAMTQAPTASLQSFYLMILIATKRHIKLMSIDVSGAFLNAKLEEKEEVYVMFPAKLAKLATQDDPSLNQYLLSNGSLVARLKKCLYGLQQSPQRWFMTIRGVLLKLGFTASQYDLCLFHKKEGDKLNLLLLYVDDMLLAFESADLADILKEALIREFEGVTTQEGDVISFLGITITQSESEITLDQQGYIKKMVESLDLENIPVYKNPLGTGYSITDNRFLKSKDEADPKMVTKLKSLSMTLMYLALRTRRDVLFLSSFFASIKCPEEQDIAAVKRAIIYTYNTIGKKQHFYREGNIELKLMGDSSHNLFINARGQGCQLIYADKWSAAINITSNVHKYVAGSAYEAELVVQDSLADMGKLYWSRLDEVGITTQKPMQMLCDNEAVVNTANRDNVTEAARTKFFNTKLFKLFEQVQDGWISSEWISTKEMDADIGTKPLTGAQYHYLSERQFSRKPGFTHGITDLESIIEYDDANEPYFDFVMKDDEHDDDEEDEGDE